MRKYVLSLIGLLATSLLIFLSCSKDKPTGPATLVPSVTTASVSIIASTTVQSGGTITSDGGSTVTVRGVCWSTNSTPTTANSRTTNGTGTGSFTSSISGLTAGTDYFVRAYATNSAGTGYGSAQPFSTAASSGTLPVLTTATISAITQTTAQSGGTITSDGGSTVIVRGVCWSTNSTPTTANSRTTNGTGTGSFTSSISGLTAGTDYFVRAYATNSAGTGYGSAKSLTTTPSSGTVPVLTTAAVNKIMETTAECGGNIYSDGGATVTARGVCWSTSATPTVAGSKTTDGAGAGSFTSSLAGLTVNTPYYVRAYATNSAGTGYGMTMAFTTALGTVTDIDGNVYQTVTIGTQVWMAENLKVIHYRNGDPIPNVVDGSTWAGLTTGAYCEYNNDPANVASYGRLYNWYAVDNWYADDSRNIAPAGWHVPSDDEWQTLVDYLGGSSVAGGKLKEVDTSHWLEPNTRATNESGFTALPGGWRTSSGSFSHWGIFGFFWPSMEPWWNYAMYRRLQYDHSTVDHSSMTKKAGFSVRCVKD